MTDALPGWNASSRGNNAVFMQASIAPDSGHTGLLESTSGFNNNGSSLTEFNDISFANVAATPEPSSLLLFCVGGWRWRSIKENVAGRIRCLTNEHVWLEWSTQDGVTGKYEHNSAIEDEADKSDPADGAR